MKQRDDDLVSTREIMEFEHQQTVFTQACKDFSSTGIYAPLQNQILKFKGYAAWRNMLFTETYSHPEDSPAFHEAYTRYQQAIELVNSYRDATDYIKKYPQERNSFPRRPLLDHYLATERLEQQSTSEQGVAKRKSKLTTLLGKEQQVGYQRSKQARRLEKNSNGKIVLRPDGRIDFPEIGIKGAVRLTSSAETDFSNPEEALVQGDYVDRYGKTGIPGMTYMTGKRAEKEAAAQGLKIFPEDQAGEIYNTLGSAGVSVHQACQILFGKEFSGYLNYSTKEWHDVGSISCLGCSELTNGFVYRLEWESIAANYFGSNQFCPQPFLACEEC